MSETSIRVKIGGTGTVTPAQTEGTPPTEPPKETE